MEEKVENQLQFVPLSSCINPSFWHKFTQFKLDVLRLNEWANIWGYYSNVNSHTKSILEVDSTSFNVEYKGLKFYLPYYGVLINKNTIEEFKECDKKSIIQSAGVILLDNIKRGNVLKNPSLLNIFMILSFADLKKYNFYYWFAFPTLSAIKPTYSTSYPVNKLFNEVELCSIYQQYSELDVNNKAYFLVKCNENAKILTISDRICMERNSENFEDYENLLFGFSDSSLMTYPGWSLRNFILLLLYYCPVLQGKTIKFLSFRLTRKGPEIKCDSSLVFEVRMPTIDVETIFSNSEENWIGFEPNERDKMGPRLAKMKDSMSPESLADTSVDLNLKLMKWRLLPDINLDRLKMTKCLLLGAGTLGCAVARNLLAWGIRTITFVDNGHVSYSNPVRQSLYTFDDCISNKEKASAAAESLLRIFPNVTTSGHSFTIPMPGHPVGDSLLSQTKESYEKLKKLISDHDIIFLLMDSRESRWLPTVISTSLKKITINAALGFDTYLVMRHGINCETEKENTPNIPTHLKCIPGNKLGCYFCNDITAPGDSFKDRTLDQQCTVTRPGVSNIAGALAVELAVSVLQHQNGARAPAFYASSKHELDGYRENECNLGIIPHSIRGFLSMFNHVLPASERYNQCIACSDTVIKLYEEKGFEFLLQVFQNSAYLEEVTGLNKIYTNCGELEDLNFSDEESA